MATVERVNGIVDEIANISFILFSVLATFLLINFFIRQVRIFRQCKTLNKNISQFKNLKIKYHINNFLILILSIETLQCILATTFDTAYAHYNSTQLKEYHLTNSCTLTYPAITSLRIPSAWWIHVPIRVSKIFHLILYPMINLLLDMVYLSYLASDYLRAVYKGLAWISLRFLVIFVLSSILETSVIGFWVGAKFLLIYDLHKYVRYALRFSRVLRGMRDEARFHGSKRAYAFKTNIHKQFIVSSIILLVILVCKASSIFFTDYGLAFDIFFNQPCYFTYLTANKVQISISPATLAGYKLVSGYLELTAGVFFILYQGMSILVYTLLLLNIILAACRCNINATLMKCRRKKVLSEQDLIRPLMDKYHKRLGLK